MEKSRVKVIPIISNVSKIKCFEIFSEFIEVLTKIISGWTEDSIEIKVQCFQIEIEKGVKIPFLIFCTNAISRTFWHFANLNFPNTFWHILGMSIWIFPHFLSDTSRTEKVRENSNVPNPVVSITISYILCALVRKSVAKSIIYFKTFFLRKFLFWYTFGIWCWQSTTINTLCFVSALGNYDLMHYTNSGGKSFFL